MDPRAFRPGGSAIRTSIVPVIALALALVPLSTAATSRVVEDAAGDDGIWGGAEFTMALGLGDIGAAGDCRSPAADIRALTLASDGTTLALSLSVADLLLDVECFLVGFGDLASDAQFEAELNRILEPSDDISLDGPTFEGVGTLLVTARTTGFGLEPCLGIGFEDFGAIRCGEVAFDVDGSELTWSVPLVGTTVVVRENAEGESFEEERDYDLRGIPFEARARTSVSIDQPFGLAQIGDQVYDDAPMIL